MALHERGMEPVVTLLHYAAPVVVRKGGWENPAIERLMERRVHVLEALAPHTRW